MKIFSADQIKRADAFTIKMQPPSAKSLMECAAETCVEWLRGHFQNTEIFYVFCGNGNNGGDGLAIARLISLKGYEVHVFFDETHSISSQVQENLEKVRDISGIDIINFIDFKTFNFKPNGVVIDALFGIGLNRKTEGISAEIIQKLNTISLPKIAIDIPSGLFADDDFSETAIVFKADHTLSFQFWKKAFLHPETGGFCGRIHILDIGINAEFIENEPSKNFIIDHVLIHQIYQPRSDFSNKGTFGNSTIVAGSFGKMGAAVLATKSALRSGSGITKTLAPKCGYEILQTTCPEAMFIPGGENFIDNIKVIDASIIGIGPGLGTEELTEKALLTFLKKYEKSLVVDADALNIISKNPENLKLIPKNSIITPHPKEFERLFDKTENSFLRLDLARKKAAELGIYIVLKDHHTQIITPEKQVYYNITGNSGMAKGGSGDALLGIITSLLAQNYSPKDAAIFGVWLHGKAGDLAAEKFSKEAMLPTDLIDELGNVFKSLA